MIFLHTKNFTRFSDFRFLLILSVCVATPSLDRHVAWAAGGQCHGLAAAVAKNDLVRLKSILDSGCNPNPIGPGLNPLQFAIAGAHVEATRLLLDAGLDPNATDSRGLPVIHWLGSGRGYTDDDLLQVAKLLESHQCKFEGASPSKGIDVLTNLAPRQVPKTLAFLASKPLGNDPSRALKAIARGGDVESVKVLLEAGADPLTGVAKTSALLDAARAGQTPSVNAMLAHVKDKEDPKILVAYQAAVQQGHEDTAQAFIARGLKVPPTSPPANPACQPRELTPEMKALLKQMGLPNASGLLGLAGAMTCKLVQQCGEMIYIDCNSAADGPAYYINQASAQLLATCGGACMRGCTNCPPKEWACTCDSSAPPLKKAK
jgi:hypothetical protein